MRQSMAFVAGLALAACPTAGRETAGDGPPSAFSPPAATASADRVARADRLARAEALLAAGRVAEARAAFEQAALQEHAADIELAILRCQMQAGEYRAALAFAAHTASAHPEVGAGAVFYAWLLHLGGQPAIAKKTLEQAEHRLPGDPALARVRALRQGKPMPASGTLTAEERLGPYAYGTAVADQARVVGGAVLLAGGNQAIAPLDELTGADPLWLRNGLGRTVRATVRRSDAATGLALLALETPLDEPGTALAASEPFPGSAGLAIGYLPGPSGAAAWPLATLGFLGKRLTPADRLLGIDVPPRLHGALVLDLAGQWVGVVLPAGANGKPRLGSVSAIRALVGEPAAATDAGRTANRPLDELYEQAMRQALQVIALRP